MVNLFTDNVWAWFDPKLPSNYAQTLWDRLAYRDEGAKYSRAFQLGKTDGKVHLFDRNTQRFRAGLAPRAKRTLEFEDKVTVNITHTARDNEPHVPFKLDTGGRTPFEYQYGVVPAVGANRKGIIVSPTGTGKTMMMALIIATLRRKTLIVLNDLILLDQTQQEMEKFFSQPVGMIGDGEFDIQDITVATVQSLRTILVTQGPKNAKFADTYNFVKSVELVIHDEVHFADTTGVGVLYPYFEKADRVYGMSATPYDWAHKSAKYGNQELEQHFGEVIYDTTKLKGVDFIALGIKVPLYVHTTWPRVKRFEYNEHKKLAFIPGKRGKYEVQDQTKNFSQARDDEILKNDQFISMVARDVRHYTDQGMSCFVYAAHSLEYGDKITKAIGGDAIFVNGSIKRQVRRDIFQQILRKERLVLVSDVGGVGLDIKTLDAIFQASDITDVRQLKGRVERAAPGKSYGILHDYCFSCDFLGKHFDTRKSQYLKDKNIVVGG